jgi:hypothetical protein
VLGEKIKYKTFLVLERKTRKSLSVAVACTKTRKRGKMKLEPLLGYGEKPNVINLSLGGN